MNVVGEELFVLRTSRDADAVFIFFDGRLKGEHTARVEGFLVLHAAPHKEHWWTKTRSMELFFVLAVSWRADRLQKDDLEAKRHLKPERVMLTEVHLVILAMLREHHTPKTFMLWRSGGTHPYGWTSRSTWARSPRERRARVEAWQGKLRGGERLFR